MSPMDGTPWASTHRSYAIRRRAATCEAEVGVSGVLEAEADGDGHGHSHGHAAEHGGGEEPLADGLHGGGIEQGDAAHHAHLADPAVGTDVELEQDDALHVAVRGDGGINGRGV